jgi:hypothetical protein
VTIPTTINGMADGVPQAMRPLYWDVHLSTATNLNVLEGSMAANLDRLPKGCKFDEVAIMVPGPWHLERLRNLLGGPSGWVEFNEAEDLVFTNPFGTRYRVHYHFFQHPNRSYRLEVMYPSYEGIDGEAGFSPLHQALWEHGRMENTSGLTRYPIPHLSFKPQRRDLGVHRDGMTAGEERMQTWGQAYGQAVQHLKDQGFIHAQTCQSTYGRFGYFLHQDAQRQLYIKPRINTRDDA